MKNNIQQASLPIKLLPTPLELQPSCVLLFFIRYFAAKNKAAWKELYRTDKNG